MFKVLKPFAGPALIVVLEVGLSMTDYHSPFVGGVLIGIFIFLFVMALFGNRALMKRFPGILEWMPFLDPSGGFATSDQLTGKMICGQSFHISAVQYDGVVRGRHFEDCEIFGPAVLTTTGIGHMVDCGFDGTSDSVFILITQDLHLA
jgi:hypothetical protein